MVKLKAINIFNYLKKQAKPRPPLPDKIWRDPFYFFAFGFGAGTVPIAPGTAGTLLAVPFYLLLQHLSLPAYVLFTVVFIAVASWASERVSREIKIHDHPGMCIDEFAGFFVTMIAAPAGWAWVILGFILFRLFDIWKPGPIGWVDKHVHGGFGMILDDVLAGVCSMVVIQLVYFLLFFLK